MFDGGESHNDTGAAQSAREDARPCGAPGCPGAAACRCERCHKLLCHGHCFRPAEDHGCTGPEPAAEEPGYERGDELTIGGTRYSVLYAVAATREGERQVLIVARLHGVCLCYRVVVGEDGGLSAPVVIYE